MADKFGSVSYTAAPKDNSIESYLMEALYLLELRFCSLDGDKAGYFLLNLNLPTRLILMLPGCFRIIQSDELVRGRAVNGFRKGEELKLCFKAVDIDGSGGLEFSEVRPR